MGSNQSYILPDKIGHTISPQERTGNIYSFITFRVEIYVSQNSICLKKVLNMPKVGIITRVLKFFLRPKFCDLLARFQIPQGTHTTCIII